MVRPDVHLVILLAAAVATGLLIAPAAQHQELFGQLDEEALLQRSNRSAPLGPETFRTAPSRAWARDATARQ